MKSLRTRAWVQSHTDKEIVINSDEAKRLGETNIMKIIRAAPYVGKSIMVISQDLDDFYLSGSGKPGAVWKEIRKNISIS